jgi:hypothetical protein
MNRRATKWQPSGKDSNWKKRFISVVWGYNITNKIAYDVRPLLLFSKERSNKKIVRMNFGVSLSLPERLG